MRTSTPENLVSQYDSLIKLNYFKPQNSYITSASGSIEVKVLVPLHLLNHWLSKITSTPTNSFKPVVKNQSEINFCQPNNDLIAKLTNKYYSVDINLFKSLKNNEF